MSFGVYRATQVVQGCRLSVNLCLLSYAASATEVLTKA